MGYALIFVISCWLIIKIGKSEKRWLSITPFLSGNETKLFHGIAKASPVMLDNSKPDSGTMGAAARKGFADNLRWASLYSVSGINRVSNFVADIACVSLGKLVE
jgi:hypothetical protein